jgi:sec-independent protein translocase protein TatA
MFRTIGPTELIIIIVVIVLLFGGKKIPDLAKGLGEGIRNFKSSVKNEEASKDEEKKQV